MNEHYQCGKFLRALQYELSSDTALPATATDKLIWEPFYFQQPSEVIQENVPQYPSLPQDSQATLVGQQESFVVVLGPIKKVSACSFDLCVFNLSGLVWAVSM